MGRLRWLHLADFHVGKDNYPQLEMFKEILAAVEEKGQKEGIPDLIFITGDIANRGKPEEYSKFRDEFYVPLLDTLGSHWQGKVFVVPGNHDVDRDKAKAVRKHSALEEIKNFLDPDEAGLMERKDLLRRFFAFQQANLSGVEMNWLERANGVYTEIMDINNIVVGILGINTAWLCKNGDKGNITPGISMVKEGLAKIKDSHMKIVLGHHPTDWFLERDREAILSLFGKHKIIYLHGHNHKISSLTQYGAGELFLSLQTGASFHVRPEDGIKRNRILWCEFEAGGTGIEAEPWNWSHVNQEWYIDSEAFPNKFKIIGADKWNLPFYFPESIENGPMTNKKPSISQTSGSVNSQIKIDTTPQEFKFLPLTIGIETLGGIFSPLILRGTPLPATRYQVFSTATDNQEAVIISMYIGERPIAQKNMQLVTAELKGIPPALKGKPQITLTIIASKDLSLKFDAVESISGAKTSVDIHESGIHLTQEKINQLLREAEENKTTDQTELRSKEDMNRVQNLIRQAEDILGDKDKFKMYDSKKIESILAELGLAIQNNNFEEMNRKATDLENLIKIGNFDFDAFKGFPFENIFGNPPKKATQSKKKYQPTIFNTRTTEALNQKDDRPSIRPMKYNIGKIFGGQKFTPDPNLCFVLMPFSNIMEPVYQDHIKPTVESQGISCERADEFVGTNIITFDIWEKINRARFMIADLTGKNPNVFYEIGIAHALGKEVILITQSKEDVPFDLKALRFIDYQFTPRGVNDLENRLAGAIKNIMSSS